MYSAARRSDELTNDGKPVTRRALHAVPVSPSDDTVTSPPPGTARSANPTAPLRPRNYATVNTPSTRRELHRSTHTAGAASVEPAATPHAPSAPHVPAGAALNQAVFNVEDFGPLSPESQDLSSAQAHAPMDLRELSIAELMWLAEMRYHLRTPEQPPLDADQLSKLFNEFSTAWHSAHQDNRWDSTFSVTSIGVALGDLIASGNPECVWVAADTDKGTIFGVRAPAQRATFFPVDAVNRRWLAGNLDWIAGFVRNAHAQIAPQVSD